MTPPQVNPALTELVQTFVAMVRKIVASDGPGPSSTDRILAAITMALGAVVLGWPKGRKLPLWLGRLVGIGHQVWLRRHWFVP